MKPMINRCCAVVGSNSLVPFRVWTRDKRQCIGLCSANEFAPTRHKHPCCSPVGYQTVKVFSIFLFNAYMLLYTNIKCTIYCGENFKKRVLSQCRTHRVPFGGLIHLSRLKMVRGAYPTSLSTQPTD